jgi:recombination endonuclease VII
VSRRPIVIDHDHACCPDEDFSCRKCVRGLPCLSCNTALGLIERKYELAGSAWIALQRSSPW